MKNRITRPGCALGLALLALITGTGAAAREERPRNVIFILSDDHRYDFMGFMPGAPAWLETPNLDRMAAGGALLENAFVTTSLCSPSRASILTGQYAHRHQIVDNDSPIPAGTVFFPGFLQAAGYRTAYIGKWHMGNVSDMPQPGFDYWVSFSGQGVYFDPLLNVNGKREQVKGYTTDLLTDHAITWLEQQRKKEPDQPFFLYLSHKAVHAEFEAAPRDKGRYAGKPIPYPATMARTAANDRAQRQAVILFLLAVLSDDREGLKCLLEILGIHRRDGCVPPRAQRAMGRHHPGRCPGHHQARRSIRPRHERSNRRIPDRPRALMRMNVHIRVPPP